MTSRAIFVYARICKAQYADLLQQVGGAVAKKNYKAAVKQVFLRSVAEYLAAAGPAVLLIDRDKTTPGPSLVKFEGSATLIGGGAISLTPRTYWASRLPMSSPTPSGASCAGATG
ncbi:hypothetical protein HAP48_0027130 [Bradyrhizobium septentrionale]|uniref:hypothetical protein n=1 Tax=Bradyrhizobium TaxID=374 RepID=UPI00041E7927|nr:MULTISPECIES: hypothetical protein [Bradyrhizobium]UGY12344.1 hypothetical protein HAP48_0027130 [Bradyrhizobium septentrionale]UGY25543.1 hypothetical protein HU675_0001035 [Bradyrhizobium septentrionale]